MDINNAELDDLRTMTAGADAPNCGDTSGGIADDRRDPEHEPARLTAEAWKEGGFYAVTLRADPGDVSKAGKVTVKGYDDYVAMRDYLHKKGYYITGEDFQTEAEYFPGLLTYENAVSEFKTADERRLELKSFPQFSKTAKIKIHDSVVIAADTGAGKSSLAINFLNDLNDDYPILYFNLEMDSLTILRRLVAVRTGIKLDKIEGYQKDSCTEAEVNAALREITSRKPLQILKDVYTLEDIKQDGKTFPGIETIIKRTTEDREEPTIVIIDHSLLVKTADKKVNGRYERFTHISEELRRMSRIYNIVLFVLLQQNREGKKDDAEPPKNSSLKESGSWENDATHIIFLWHDPEVNQKKLIITKNRSGEVGEFVLDYTPPTQRYREVKNQSHTTGKSSITNATKRSKLSPRERKELKLREAIDLASIKAEVAGQEVTAHDVADAAGVNVSTVKRWMKEFGGYDLNGEYLEPAGINDIVGGDGFVKPTPIVKNEIESLFKQSDK